MGLTIDIKDSYNILVEEESKFRDSFFLEIYKQGAKVLEGILEKSDKDTGTTIYNDHFNNIISFTGERGAGKSSCMVSFTTALKNKEFDKSSFFKGYTKVQKSKIVSLDIVDPSIFKKDDNLLEIIVAKMFARFEECIKSGEDRSFSQDNKRKMLTLFQDVFKSLKIIKNGKKELYDSEVIEVLSELAAGSNLKSKFSSLVNGYLKYIDKGDTLLIPIDDFDLNISNAYNMLEDIRQVLVQEKIVLFIACKMEQLKDSIEQEIIKEYKEHSKFYKEESGYIKTEVNNKANKYLEKLFPYSHQLILPNLFIYDNKQISDQAKDKNEIYTIKLSDDNWFSGGTFQDVVLNFIYSKTKVFVSKPINDLSTLLPKTLRGVHVLINQLNNTNNPVEALKNYVLLVAGRDLSSDQVRVFNSLEDKSYYYLNVSILNMMNDLSLFKQVKEVESKKDGQKKLTTGKDSEIFEGLCNAKNPKNVSIGDVYMLFVIIERNLEYINKEDRYFIDLLKLYYAVRVKRIEENEKELKHIINGGFYNYHRSLFPKENGQHRRDWVPFSYDLFKQLSNEEKYLLSFFIYQYGDITENYLETKSSDFHKVKNNVLYVQFFPLGPLSNIYFMKELWEEVYGEIHNVSDIPILTKDYRSKTQLLLNNVFFFEEFLKILDVESKGYKEALSSYGDSLMIYYTELFRKSFEKLNEKYTYLKLEDKYYLDNPILSMGFDESQPSGIDFKELFNNVSSYRKENKSSKEFDDVSFNIESLIFKSTIGFDKMMNEITPVNDVIRGRLNWILDNYNNRTQKIRVIKNLKKFLTSIADVPNWLLNHIDAFILNYSLQDRYAFDSVFKIYLRNIVFL